MTITATRRRQAVSAPEVEPDRFGLSGGRGQRDPLGPWCQMLARGSLEGSAGGGFGRRDGGTLLNFLERRDFWGFLGIDFSGLPSILRRLSLL